MKKVPLSESEKRIGVKIVPGTSTPNSGLNEGIDDPFDYTDFDKSGWIDNKYEKWAILRYDDPDFRR
tara:strand:+ start:265 stop:465 length:201 start_codon:yes stop_codon:yes gene_type:complete